MDFSQIAPETIEQLMQAFGAKSPEELMQLAQQNPQMAQQILSSAMGAGSVSGSDPNADWMEQSADTLAAPGARKPTMSEGVPPLTGAYKKPGTLYIDPRQRQQQPADAEEEY